MPPGSPPELLKAAETFSNLKLGFRGDLKFQQNPEVIEVAHWSRLLKRSF